MALGFIPDITEYQTEITALSNVIGEYRDSLNCGEADPAEVIPELLEKLTNAGEDTLIEAIQTQITDWGSFEISSKGCGGRSGIKAERPFIKKG